MNTNGAELHLLINHFPVVGYPIVFIALAWGLFNRQNQIFLFGVYLSVLIWVSSFISYLTGEGAEDVLRELPDFNIDLIHQHEDTAFIALIVGGVAALLGLCLTPWFQNKVSFFKKASFERWGRLAVLGLILIVCVLFAVAAHQGGVIRHSEIR